MGKTRDHKHRDLIDDILDLGLLVGAATYYIVVDVTDFELGAKTVALLAGLGATARTLSRRILSRLLSNAAGAPPSDRFTP